jgi:hypothetical protein
MICINEGYVATGFIEARRGVLVPRPIVLKAGQVIYRFYDSKRAALPKHGAMGPWWIEDGYIKKMKQYASIRGFSLEYTARLFAAIADEWGEVDSLVQCQFKQPLKALIGRGKQLEGSQKDKRNLSTNHPLQNILEIYQLYLPGVGGFDRKLNSSLIVTGNQKLNS